MHVVACRNPVPPPCVALQVHRHCDEMKPLYLWHSRDQRPVQMETLSVKVEHPTLSGVLLGETKEKLETTAHHTWEKQGEQAQPEQVYFCGKRGLYKQQVSTSNVHKRDNEGASTGVRFRGMRW